MYVLPPRFKRNDSVPPFLPSILKAYFTNFSLSTFFSFFKHSIPMQQHLEASQKKTYKNNRKTRGEKKTKKRAEVR